MCEEAVCSCSEVGVGVPQERGNVEIEPVSPVGKILSKSSTRESV
jgi:hypothetical protein